MLQMKRCTEANREAVLHIWGVQFGDEAEFIDSFAKRFGWEQILLLWEDGVPCAVTAIPLMELALEDGTVTKGGYIYAHTTLKEHRGKGFGGLLLKYADFCLENQGAKCALVVPEHEGLFPYFAANGYETAFCHRRGRAAASAPLPIAPLTAEEYSRLRERLLAGTAHGVTPLGMLELQKELCLAAGGDLYAVDTGTGTAVAVVAERMEDGALSLRELVAPEGQAEMAAAGLAGALGAPAAAFRTPCAEGGTPFGMVKWFGKQPHGCCGHGAGYFGLALD